MRKINKIFNVLFYISGVLLIILTIGIVITTALLFFIDVVGVGSITEIVYWLFVACIFILHITLILLNLSEHKFKPSKKEIIQERNKMVEEKLKLVDKLEQELEQEVTDLRFDISYLNAKVRILEPRIKVKVDKPIDKTSKDKK